MFLKKKRIDYNDKFSDVISVNREIREDMCCVMDLRLTEYLLSVLYLVSSMSASSKALLTFTLYTPLRLDILNFNLTQ